MTYLGSASTYGTAPSETSSHHDGAHSQKGSKGEEKKIDVQKYIYAPESYLFGINQFLGVHHSKFRIFGLLCSTNGVPESLCKRKTPQGQDTDTKINKSPA